MRRKWMMVALCLLVPAMMMFASCAPTEVKPQEQTADDSTGTGATPEPARVEPQPVDPTPEPPEVTQPTGPTPTERNEFLQPIHFDYDSAVIKAEAEMALRSKADYLKKYPTETAVIAGHCDERGTNEYNLALGDRRAESAKNYLINLGVDGSRLTTVSYGEEQPVDPSSNESAWAKNRRDEFSLQ